MYVVGSAVRGRGGTRALCHRTRALCQDTERPEMDGKVLDVQMPIPDFHRPSSAFRPDPAQHS